MLYILQLSENWLIDWFILSINCCVSIVIDDSNLDENLPIYMYVPIIYIVTRYRDIIFNLILCWYRFVVAYRTKIADWCRREGIEPETVSRSNYFWVRSMFAPSQTASHIICSILHNQSDFSSASNTKSYNLLHLTHRTTRQIFAPFQTVSQLKLRVQQKRERNKVGPRAESI